MHALLGCRLGAVAVTTVAVSQEDIDNGLFVAAREGATTNRGQVGENIFGPFEAGFTARQNGILESLGCEDGSLGHVAGGIDTHTAEQMVAAQCDITLPRWENGQYVSLLDQCGGHTAYQFHEKLICLYDVDEPGHSSQVGKACAEGEPLLYGKYENVDTVYGSEEEAELPMLDACGGQFGVTPDSNGAVVYHYHVQDAPPFTFGCFGPTDDGQLVTVEQCREWDAACDGVFEKVLVPGPNGTKVEKLYDLWCSCFDANGNNTGIDIAPLPVFQHPELLTKASVESKLSSSTELASPIKVTAKPTPAPTANPTPAPTANPTPAPTAKPRSALVLPGGKSKTCHASCAVPSKCTNRKGKAVKRCSGCTICTGGAAGLVLPGDDKKTCHKRCKHQRFCSNRKTKQSCSGCSMCA